MRPVEMPFAAKSRRLLGMLAGAVLWGAPLSAANIVVNTTSDVFVDGDGLCTLREAILASNNNAGVDCTAGSPLPVRDTIRFSVAGTIVILAGNGQLPILTGGKTTIDGWSAPGGGPGQRPQIVLNGQQIPFGIGIYIQSSHNVVRGLAIGGFEDFGIHLETPAARRNWILDNRIGTNPAGNQARPNGTGVAVRLGAHHNLIGTNGDGVRDGREGNLISGNSGDGVDIGGAGSDNNRLSGNRIGTNAAGTAALGNGFNGVVVGIDTEKNVVGTDSSGTPGDAAEGNLISGNGETGLVVGGPESGDHVVAGNFIGVNAAGNTARPNKVGIEVADGTVGVRIGTNGDGVSDSFERNVVSGNTSHGIILGGSDHSVAGNYVGTDANGNFPVPNLFGITATLDLLGGNGNMTIGGADERFRNLVSGNTNAGISVQAPGVTVECNFIGTDVFGNTDVRNGVGVNVIMGNAVNAAVRSNRIAFNGLGALSTEPSLQFTNNVVADNDAGFQWTDTGVPDVVDVTDNWWGDPSGPTHASNPGGIGDTVDDLSGGTADFLPFQSAKPTLCAVAP